MAALDGFLGCATVWGRSDVVRTTVPHGDEDEEENEEDASCSGADGGSGRCSGGELAGGEGVEDRRHGRMEVDEVLDRFLSWVVGFRGREQKVYGKADWQSGLRK